MDLIYKPQETFFYSVSSSWSLGVNFRSLRIIFIPLGVDSCLHRGVAFSPRGLIFRSRSLAPEGNYQCRFKETAKIPSSMFSKKEFYSISIVFFKGILLLLSFNGRNKCRFGSKDLTHINSVLGKFKK